MQLTIETCRKKYHSQTARVLHENPELRLVQNELHQFSMLQKPMYKCALLSLIALSFP